jgi:hypothetical protein
MLLKIYVNWEIASGYRPRNDTNASKVSQALDVSFGGAK